MKRTVVLVILDGWGIGSTDESNPIYMAAPKTINYINRTYPSGGLQASGLAVGLPWEEEGNSEVGHLTIGAGRVLFQHFPKISLAIDNGSFFKNDALVKAFAHAKKNGSAVHLAGLLSAGNVHASLGHLAALIDMARREGCEKLYLHLFLDGRDSAPKSARELLDTVNAATAKYGCGVVASLSGRYYAMDRDLHWERTEKAYRVLVGDVVNPTTVDEVLGRSYKEGVSDEFVEPTVVAGPHPIQSNDAVIFFNFRGDRMRQLAQAFVDPSFPYFPVHTFTDLMTVGMTEFKTTLPIEVAFKTEVSENPLGKVLAVSGKSQLRVAETEKYAHVTYFFNGLREQPFKNEFRVLIPSQRVARYDTHPEMMASTITDRVLVALNESTFDFILVNYANPDMVAHTGNYDATVRAIGIIDAEIARLLEKTLAGGHILLITSDHGNAESVLNLHTGISETKHDANPVPVYLIAKEFERRIPHEGFFKPETIGILSDVAPTVLELLGLQKPKEMTGESLMDQLTHQTKQ